MANQKPHPVNRLLAPFGLAVRRTSHSTAPAFAADGVPVPLRVGRFEILMFPASQLFQIYSEHPDYSGELGFVAGAIVRKYPDSRVIDVGANVGDTLAVIRTHCDAPVLAIEGDEASHGLLARNAALFPRITILKAFLGEHKGEMSARVEKAGWNATLVPAEHGKGGVPGRVLSIDTLDGVLSRLDERGEYRLLKIDTEGFDLRIIRGGAAYIADVKPAVFFEYNRANLDPLGEDGLATFAKLAQMGYEDALVWDSDGRFLLSASLANSRLIADLHDYIAGGRAPIAYFDVCLFHSRDRDVALECAQAARGRRFANDGPRSGGRGPVGAGAGVEG